jgi:hypothetical protein
VNVPQKNVYTTLVFLIGWRTSVNRGNVRWHLVFRRFFKGKLARGLFVNRSVVVRLNGVNLLYVYLSRRSCSIESVIYRS